MKCFDDDYKYTKICIDENEISLKYSKKGVKEYNSWIKKALKNGEITMEEKQIYQKTLPSLLKDNAVNINLNNVEFLSCEFDKIYDQDQMFIYDKNKDSLTTFKLKKNSCKKIVSEDYIKNKNIPYELFESNILQKRNSM